MSDASETGVRPLAIIVFLSGLLIVGSVIVWMGYFCLRGLERIEERLNRPIIVAIDPKNPLFSVIHGYTQTGDKKGEIRMVRVDDQGRLLTTWTIPADPPKIKE